MTDLALQAAQQAAEARQDKTQENKSRHWRPIALELANTVDALSARLAQAEQVIRVALPSLGANQRSYAQDALEEACALLNEDPDAWRGPGELALEREWREKVAQAEQERDMVAKTADEWITNASRLVDDVRSLEARLREYEEALDKLVPDVRLLVTAYYSGTPDDLKAADAPASRLDAMLFDDDGAPRSVLAPKVAGD